LYVTYKKRNALDPSLDAYTEMILCLFKHKAEEFDMIIFLNSITA